MGPGRTYDHWYQKAAERDFRASLTPVFVLVPHTNYRGGPLYRTRTRTVPASLSARCTGPDLFYLGSSRYRFLA